MKKHVARFNRKTESRRLGRKKFHRYPAAVIYDASLDELLQKVWDGKRINAADAKRLYSLPLEELGALADHRRQLAKANAYNNRGNEIVTYNVDRNVNYTNVCNVYCKFCAFYRTEKDDDSYVISLPELDKKIGNPRARRQGIKPFGLGSMDAFAVPDFLEQFVE